MKRVLSALVLVFSLSAAGVYVWKSSQKNPRPPSPQEVVTDHATLPPVMPENPGTQEIIVTDEEVRATREAMLSTSKSGLIMSEEDVRKMLEKRKRAARDNDPFLPAGPDADDLAPSSKSSGSVITREELERALESRKTQEQSE